MFLWEPPDPSLTIPGELCTRGKGELSVISSRREAYDLEMSFIMSTNNRRTGMGSQANLTVNLLECALLGLYLKFSINQDVKISC